MFEMTSYKSINVNRFKKPIINYVENNPCCDDYLNCHHAKKQSNTFLHQCKEIYPLVEDYYLKLKLLCKQNKIKFNKFNYVEMWAFLSKAGNKIDSIKHNHSIDKSSYEISSVLYFDNGKLGTNLYIKNNCVELPEEKNKWFFFSSKIDHAPKKGLVKKDRLVLATSVGLCLEN